MPITRPKHLDPPDEVTLGTHRIHKYEAASDGKLLLESLLWLCGRYRHVNLVAINEPEHIKASAEIHCYAPYIENDFKAKTGN
jgi:hypothetical protein